jgi:hypothetical protein
MVYIVQGLNLAARLPSPPPQFNPRNKSNQSDKTMKYLLTTTTLFAALSLSSCESGPNADRGTLIGAGTGALAGGIIGHQSGNTAAGAAIGAVAGGVIGNQVGANQDRKNYGRVVGYDQYGRPIYQY